MTTLNAKDFGPFSMGELELFGAELLHKCGLSKDKATVVAQHLVAADGMGKKTHGMNLLPIYLDAILNGEMNVCGEPTIIADRASMILIDGNYLPGPWLLHFALDRCRNRMLQYGQATAVIRRGFHIGCLSVFLKTATEMGYLILLASSDPGTSSVAPFGSRRAVLSTNPIAFGIPTLDSPILVDFSSSSVSVGAVRQHKTAGEKLKDLCLIDQFGNYTDEASCWDDGVNTAIVPLGGKSFGYKGFGLALGIEALTSGLGGSGRGSEDPLAGSASIFMQLYDPAAFSGKASFESEMSFVANECRRDGGSEKGFGAMVPGDRSRRTLLVANETGVFLSKGLWEELVKWSLQLDVETPML